MGRIHIHPDTFPGTGFDTGFDFAIALANTWDVWFEDPEKLKTPTALDQFLSGQGWEGSRETEQPELDAVRQLRSELRSIFTSPTAGEATGKLTTLLGELAVVPRLTIDEPTTGPVIVAFGPRPGADLPEQLRVVAGLGLADALERWGVDRFRMCDADRCEDVFVDTSKNGRRRYCGVRCQNRINVAALRQRTAQAQQGHD